MQPPQQRPRQSQPAPLVRSHRSPPLLQLQLLLWPWSSLRLALLAAIHLLIYARASWHIYQVPGPHS
eukprot:COSAG06_NODE_2116_length_7557_cov_122.672298_3_plen_67_part_00